VVARLAVAAEYVALGFTHILPGGLDHILFVLGIFLLAQRARPVLAQVTAFTLAHSITLGLAMYGVLSLPSRIVEPLIALSIVYVAVENVLRPRLTPWRVAVVFCFGLLHGLGFAGALRELGLPRSQFLLALVTFNVGVELGQLAVLAAAFVLVASWARHEQWYRSRVVVPASLAIAAVGLWWTLERTML
jgi:hydrogenase/urease accessory protein HupE